MSASTKTILVVGFGLLYWAVLLGLFRPYVGPRGLPDPTACILEDKLEICEDLHTKALENCDRGDSMGCFWAATVERRRLDCPDLARALQHYNQACRLGLMGACSEALLTAPLVKNCTACESLDSGPPGYYRRAYTGPSCP